MVSRLSEGHMPCTFFLSEPQLKTTVKSAPNALQYLKAEKTGQNQRNGLTAVFYV